MDLLKKLVEVKRSFTIVNSEQVYTVKNIHVYLDSTSDELSDLFEIEQNRVYWWLPFSKTETAGSQRGSSRGLKSSSVSRRVDSVFKSFFQGSTCRSFKTFYF